MSDILVEQVLRFKYKGRIVHVASDKKGMTLLVQILSALSRTGEGLPGGTVQEGTLADMNYDPHYLVSSDGTPLKECPLPPDYVRFPKVPKTKEKANAT